MPYAASRELTAQVQEILYNAHKQEENRNSDTYDGQSAEER